MDDVQSVVLGTLFGFLLLAGFCMMLYIAFKAIWIAGRMTANRKRSQRAFAAEQKAIILGRDRPLKDAWVRHN